MIGMPRSEGDKLIVCDEPNFRVHGPAGSFSASRPVIRVLDKMSDGQRYNTQELCRLGSWGRPELLMQSLTQLLPKLEAAGIELCHAGKHRLRIRKLEK